MNIKSIIKFSLHKFAETFQGDHAAKHLQIKRGPPFNFQGGGGGAGELLKEIISGRPCVK